MGILVVFKRARGYGYRRYLGSLGGSGRWDTGYAHGIELIAGPEPSRRGSWVV